MRISARILVAETVPDPEAGLKVTEIVVFMRRVVPVLAFDLSDRVAPWITGARECIARVVPPTCE